MRIKSYFSGTVESAMELARRELGEEAVILNSRPAPADARHLGAYEVVFGVDDAPAIALEVARTSKESAAAIPPGRGHRFEILEGEIAALRHELRHALGQAQGRASDAGGVGDARVGDARVGDKVARGGLSSGTDGAARDSVAAGHLPAESRQAEQDLVSFLLRRDLPERLARELVRRGRERLTKGQAGGWRTTDETGRNGVVSGQGQFSPGLFTPSLFCSGTGVFPAHPGVLAGLFADESALASAVLDQIAAVVRVDASLGRSGQAAKVVALVGGAGAGKTTTLVKLAAHYGLRARRPAHIISTDNLRVGAAEQLRSYAAILGVGFDLAETAVALGQLLNEHASKDLILIDTPGLGPGQMEDGAAVARFLGNDPRVDCHLVVPAYQKSPDVARLLDRFHPYGASKVILTRLDETEAIGGLLLALDESGASISFLSMGQTIPEDLEPASRARLLDLLVGDPPMGTFLSQRDLRDGESIRREAPEAPRHERMASAGSR